VLLLPAAFPGRAMFVHKSDDFAGYYPRLNYSMSTTKPKDMKDQVGRTVGFIRGIRRMRVVQRRILSISTKSNAVARSRYAICGVVPIRTEHSDSSVR
jgi:hypothetical protein